MSGTWRQATDSGYQDKAREKQEKLRKFKAHHRAAAVVNVNCTMRSFLPIIPRRPEASAHGDAMLRKYCRSIFTDVDCMRFDDGCDVWNCRAVLKGGLKVVRNRLERTAFVSELRESNAI